MSDPRWYQTDIKEVFRSLETGESGLTPEEAGSRLLRYGYNELISKGRSAFARLIDQFRSPLVWILLIAAMVTTTLSALHIEEMWIDSAVIAGVVILNILLGYYQEGKADSALEALKRMAVPECKVVRGGQSRIIPSRELVLGDVVILEGGDKVPADIRLFYARSLYADEAALTGESNPVEKDIASIGDSIVGPADQHCIAHAGTFVTRGSGRGVVVATAENTEFGKIARLMKQTKVTPTPLQRRIADFTRVLVIGIIGLGLINFIIGVSFGQDLVYMFLASVAVIVAGMPEMLPMIVTGILAMSATAMAARKVLIRRLPAAETLGCTTVICSDKTGTLTKNEMTVQMLYAGCRQYEVTGAGYNREGKIVTAHNSGRPADSADLRDLLRAGFCCNNASLQEEDGQYKLVGDPTEGALMVVALKGGISETCPRLDEIPFDSEIMYMATLNEVDGRNMIYAKGSPEKILSMCSCQQVEGKTVPLNRQEAMENSALMAGKAMRVLGLACKAVELDKRSLSPDDMTGLVFLGLQGMIDPPRQEAIEAVQKCRSAGIRVVMITGDHVLTAEAIARKLGILRDKENGVLSGEQLFQMSDDDLYRVVNNVSVYARVAPEHKLKIAQQLRRRGEIVAMTGDGVNDAPALKAADIGVAMGISGTEVSKEASSMILTDDNFASIVAAVEEGRHGWKNLEKAILYTLPTNGGQMLLIMGAILIAPLIPLFALRLPLEPIHILWINLADSVFLTLPLLFEPREKGLLQEPPRDPNGKITNKLFFIRVGLVSLAMAITGFMIYWQLGHSAMVQDAVSLNQAQTAVFIGIQLLHVGYLITARSLYDSAFKVNPFSNRWVIAGIAVTLVTQLLIIYTPVGQYLFKTTAFPLQWWPFVLLALLPGFAVIELEKLIRKVYKKR